MSFEREIRVKFDAKIACVRGRRNGCAMESKGIVSNFSSLMWGTNDKVFSFSWVYGKAVESKPGINGVKSGRKNGKACG